MKSILYPVFHSISIRHHRAVLEVAGVPENAERKSHFNTSSSPRISFSVLFFPSLERFAVIGGGSLQIINLTEEDAGIYVCQVDSGNMTSEIQAELTVHGTFHENIQFSTNRLTKQH